MLAADTFGNDRGNLMSDTCWREEQSAVAPERLRNYVQELLSAHKSKSEIESELMAFGVDREAASAMVNDALDAQWHAEGGGGPVLAQVGPRHMMLGALVCAAGIAATALSAYSVVEFDAPVGFIFYGAMGAGAIDFAYGLIRFLEG